MNSRKSSTTLSVALALSRIESEMSSLNADRKNLQDLIELWLQANWDIEQVEWIMVKLWELAEKRKQLKEVS